MQTKVDIINALDTLDPEQLNKVAIYITDIRRAEWGLSGPSVDERPKEAELGPRVDWTSRGPYGGFQGKETNPLPLDSKKGTTIIEAIVEDMDFECLIKVAKKLEVPCPYRTWLDDDFPDKEDELRVAVAEAMERVGK